VGPESKLQLQSRAWAYLITPVKLGFNTDRRQTILIQETYTELPFDQTSRRQHVCTITYKLHREAAMAEEIYDAIG
jgi:hypothetical protein